MDYKQNTLDVGAILRKERPHISDYVEKKMALVPQGGVTREMFGMIVQELSEMMFARGVDRMMNKLRGELPVAKIDEPHKKCS